VSPNLRSVETPADEAVFLAVPRVIHAGDPARVELPDEMLRFVFDPRCNGYFDRGEAARWILEDAHGAPLGRVAAFYRQRDTPDALGGVGFFECVDDERAAATLFEAAESWLAARGLAGADGPVNFGERDRMWGLLVRGHEQAPVYLDNHHPAYYERLFAAAGYRPLMESLSYCLPAEALDMISLAAKYQGKARAGRRRRFATLAELGPERFAEGMFHVYRAAFSAAGRARHWTARELQGWLEADVTLDGEWMWLGYVDDEPAVLLGYQPDLYQLEYQERIDRLKGFVTAVHPDHQGQGLLAGVGLQLHTALNRAGFREVLMTGIAGHSARIRAVVERAGAHVTRVHATWRKHFDPQRAVEPLAMPVWGDGWTPPAERPTPRMGLVAQDVT
jgi:hypothetical protein